MLTQTRLKELLHYNPNTGIFHWKQRNFPGIKVGREAGTTPTGNTYRRIKIAKRSYQASVLAWLYMTGEFPVQQVDHINLNRTDNRIANLRPCSPRQNMGNLPMMQGKRVKLKGVQFEQGRYRARIADHGKLLHLGIFDTAEEAHAAYMEAAKKIFGEFARAG